MKSRVPVAGLAVLAGLLFVVGFFSGATTLVYASIACSIGAIVLLIRLRL